MTKVEILRSELIAVSKVVERHEEVAEIVGISAKYSQQIRKGKGAKTDTKENQKLIQKLIDTYRKLGAKKIEELNKVVVVK